MKTTGLYVAAMALLATSALAAPSGIDKEIRRLEDQVNAAYAANDLPKYFSYYAKDLRAMYPEGPTTLPDYIVSWTKFIHDGGAVKAFKIGEMRVQIGPSGDTAVASYQAVASVQNPGKAVEDEHFNETDVWFKRHGAWKIVEIHYSEFTPTK
jgi:ketosteroid isomerase-like protein